MSQISHLSDILNMSLHLDEAKSKIFDKKNNKWLMAQLAR